MRFTLLEKVLALLIVVMIVTSVTILFIPNYFLFMN